MTRYFGLTSANSLKWQPHSSPITPMMRDILERRCVGSKPEEQLFKVVSAEHIYSMTMRLGWPRLMLHDLRKLVATVGENLGQVAAVQHRIQAHCAENDVLHRHYVELNACNAAVGLVKIHDALNGLMSTPLQTIPAASSSLIKS
jgi:hypothetical protein